MMLIDPELLQQLELSTCFGIAHDAEARECKSCDLQQECMAKTQGNKVFDPVKMLKPETAKAMQKARAEKEDEIVRSTTKKKKPKNPEGMPDTRGMSLEDLWSLLEKRGGTCKVYDNEAIQKMRVIMAIKATY